MRAVDAIVAREWDYVVVGTGVGGATFGHAVARAGKSVLFLEAGSAAFRRPDALLGVYPETCLDPVVAAAPHHASLLGRAGRRHEAVLAGKHAFVPLIGSGAGGSSALFGMAMERFFPVDFAPGQNLRDWPEASSLPEAWPIGYSDLAPWYARAERLYRVKGGRDPLRPQCDALPHAPAPSPVNAELWTHFESRGLNPYRLPLACEFVPGCECCQGYLCPRACKNDAASICLAPAIREHGAQLLEECRAVGVEAGADHATGVTFVHRDRTLTVRAFNVVLAAGALATPELLLNSRSVHWPEGLANSSGLVGRNLMRHCVDLYLVFPRARGDNRMKEIGLSDFYCHDGVKLGTLQSFGALPPASVLTATMAHEVRQGAAWASPLFGLMQPLMRGILRTLFERGVLLAAIMEDFPYRDNCIRPGSPPRLEYRLQQDELNRLAAFRQRVSAVLKPYRFLLLAQAHKNTMLAHVCGTCRFGDDAATSVLDRMNRAHGVRNLYVVDASFFPSSGGTNPALTIAANALRVAHHLLNRPEEEI